MLRTKIIRLLRLNIDHADDAILGHQGHGKLGAHLGVRIDVIRKRADVVDQHRLSALRHLSYDAFAHANAQPLCVCGMTNLEAHAQLIGAVVQQQDGKNAVINDGAHQVCHAMQQRLQIQRGIQRIGQPGKKVPLHRIDSRLVAKRHRRTWAIITLIRVMFSRVLGIAGTPGFGFIWSGGRIGVDRRVLRRSFSHLWLGIFGCGFAFVGTHGSLFRIA